MSDVDTRQATSAPSAGSGHVLINRFIRKLLKANLILGRPFRLYRRHAGDVTPG
jgi:hypothetical protein